jgi:hypothetical protein
MSAKKPQRAGEAQRLIGIRNQRRRPNGAGCGGTVSASAAEDGCATRWPGDRLWAKVR